MAQQRSVGIARVVADILLPARRRTPASVAVAVFAAVACVVLGAISLTIQQHFAGLPPNGRLVVLLRNGSTTATAWEGWAAAALFGWAVVRLRRGSPEPPAGRTPVEELTITQMRTGLLREYTAVRAGVVFLAAVSLVEAARSARYVVASLSGDALARGSLGPTILESAGLMAATAVLVLWAAAFRGELERVGALVAF